MWDYYTVYVTISPRSSKKVTTIFDNSTIKISINDKTNFNEPNDQ